MTKKLYLETFEKCLRSLHFSLLGNVAKFSGECPKIFQGMSPNILGNVAKHSEECR